jgi:hypothetical protein
MDTKNWQVKGSLLLDYIRMIKANKDKPWHKYLTPEDMEIIEGRVLPSVWYPYETFRRCGLATFHELAGGKVEAVRAWGKISMEQLVKGLYSSVVTEKDPMKAIERFVSMRRQFFDFDARTHEKVGEKHIKVRLQTIPDREGIEAYTAQLTGGFEKLIELTGGKNPKIVLTKKQWAGDPVTELDISWE